MLSLAGFLVYLPSARGLELGIQDVLASKLVARNQQEEILKKRT